MNSKKFVVMFVGATMIMCVVIVFTILFFIDQQDRAMNSALDILKSL